MKGLRLVLLVLIALTAASAAVDASASSSKPATVLSATPITVMPVVATPVVATPATRDAASLAGTIAGIVSASGAGVGVSLVELGGTLPLSWSVNGSAVFAAASTYKLAALMMEAQGIAAGKIDPNGLVYFEANDYEDGVFDDYTVGVGYTRSLLAYRAGYYSDNTAGHMLVRDVGGAAVLNAWAAALGATGSSFFDGNTTTAADLTASGWPRQRAGWAAPAPRPGSIHS